MTSPSLPSISTLPSAPDTTHKSVLDTLFEPSSTLHNLTLPILRSTPFPSYDVLITAIHAQLSALASSSEPDAVEKLREILCAHPRLGEKKVESVQSQGEQKSLGSEAEREELQALNKEYEDKFPGLRYVVFVNGRPRTEIMQNMRERIDRGDAKMERVEAIQAMCDIAADRARKLETAA